MRFIVAIDGTAGSGKGTIGRAVSRHYNFKYLDTGLLYRAVAFNLRTITTEFSSISEKMILKSIKGIDKNLLELKELRNNEISEIASLLATNFCVREKLLDYQRNFANQKGGTVLDGRDIGTIVCPDADVKVYIDAEEGVRAKRRTIQFKKQNIEVTYQEVLRNLKKRDRQDRNRAIAPMLPSSDALMLDSTNMSIEESLGIIILRINEELKKITLNS